MLTRFAPSITGFIHLGHVYHLLVLLDEDQETVAGWLNEANTEAAPTRMSRENAEDPQAAGKSALREKLGELVRAGKLTREEAGEVYQAAFPSRR